MKRRKKTREYTDAEKTKVKFLKAAGNTNELIAKVLDSTVHELKKNCKEFLQTCNAELDGIVCANLFKQTRNNPAAAIFWMKARAGWSTVFTATDPDSGESIKIQLIKGPTPAPSDED